MSQARYVERTADEVRGVLEGAGFVEAEYTRERWSKIIPWERVWERPVIFAKGTEFPYTVVCYSSVDRRTDRTRACSKDAIKLVLINKAGKPIARAEKKVYRTKGAMENMLQRARELFDFVVKSETCPKCNSLMDERTVKKDGPNKGKKFLGCSDYPNCNGTIWDYNPDPIEPADDAAKKERYINEMSAGTRERPRHRRTA